MDFFDNIMLPDSHIAYAEGETSTSTAADSSAAQGQGAAGTQGNIMAILMQVVLPMALIIGLLYFVMIRPQRKKDKEAKAMIDAMKVGDKVTTIGGINGKVTKIKDNYVIIETGNVGTPAECSHLKMERDSIKTVEQKIKS